jgi:ABC-type cobalamin/Fe3+-siderophores transport system ATPase subunit
MIEARQLTKRYGEKTAVDGVDFTVRPGAVTGFLGPNGAGKSTTMRMIIGLDAPTAGSVTVNGRRYAQHAAPLQEVGALLEVRSIHPGTSDTCSTPFASTNGSTTTTAHTRAVPTPGRYARCPHRSRTSAWPLPYASTDMTASAASSTSTSIPPGLPG